MEFAGQPLPLQRLATVWHIGSFDAADKGCHGASLEGTGLSVSVDPDAWEAIAKLGGYPWWKLHRKEGAFVDFHALGPEHLDAITQWGLARGWLCMQPQWELSYYDDELDDRRLMTFDTAEEAQAELEEYAVYDESAKVEAVVRPCPTEQMHQRLGFKSSVFGALDIVATFWVEDETQLDGVWWWDLLDPQSLSAPRGVIVRRALGGWTHRKAA